MTTLVPSRSTSGGASRHKRSLWKKSAMCRAFIPSAGAPRGRGTFAGGALVPAAAERELSSPRSSVSSTALRNSSSAALVKDWGLRWRMAVTRPRCSATCRFSREISRSFCIASSVPPKNRNIAQCRFLATSSSSWRWWITLSRIASWDRSSATCVRRASTSVPGGWDPRRESWRSPDSASNMTRCSEASCKVSSIMAAAPGGQRT
mmetsp:Transcript_51332/g.135259  ORF Transcript_51332/g.135259 Transcript_51332/m.135259 type:complete len:206 (+) Transcript_51332:52-669(+)